ncbi:MAG: zinc-ribbon domain-containing protein [Anaerolineae bacterium]
MDITAREVVVFGLVVLAVLLGGLLLLGLFWGLGGMGFGMMGPGMMGPGMMGGFGAFWWLLACLIPLGLIALLVLGAVWLLSTARGIQGPDMTSQGTCPNCGRPGQADWQVCPHCGTPLGEDDAV